ncbi:MAG TPA: hypothetical protein VJL29_16365 [Thermoguttaceae bacterium]|nr:hypothetical protein [Thermoguttaceae bacterium]
MNSVFFLLTSSFTLHPFITLPTSHFTLQEWGIVVGVVVSFMLAVGPWMFMVHAKLAVLASQVAALCQKVDHAAETEERLWLDHARHATRLEAHDVQIGQIDLRLRELCE